MGFGIGEAVIDSGGAGVGVLALTLRMGRDVRKTGGRIGIDTEGGQRDAPGDGESDDVMLGEEDAFVISDKAGLVEGVGIGIEVELGGDGLDELLRGGIVGGFRGGGR